MVAYIWPRHKSEISEWSLFSCAEVSLDFWERCHHGIVVGQDPVVVFKGTLHLRHHWLFTTLIFWSKFHWIKSEIGETWIESRPFPCSFLFAIPRQQRTFWADSAFWALHWHGTSLHHRLQLPMTPFLFRWKLDIPLQTFMASCKKNLILNFLNLDKQW